MNILNYIARQRERVISRHIGETFFVNGEESVEIGESEEFDLLKEMASIKGLNVAERLRARCGAYECV